MLNLKYLKEKLKSTKIRCYMFLNNNWILSLLLSAVAYIFYKFRYQLFYSENVAVKALNEVKDYNLVDYTEQILSNGITKKQRISHDLINDIYVTTINKEKINIKKLKTLPVTLRVLLQLISKGPLWLYKYFKQEQDTLMVNQSPIIEQMKQNNTPLFNGNHLGLKLCQHKSEACNQFNLKVLEAIILNIPEASINCNDKSNEEKKQILDKILLPIFDFIRGAGYLHYRQLVNNNIEWQQKDFFKLVQNIGKVLDSDIFRIRIRLAQTQVNFTVPFNKFDLIVIEFRSTVFHSVKDRAKLQLNQARVSLKEAGKKAKEHFKNFNSEFNEIFYPTQEKIMDSLSEVQEVQASTPDAYANDKKIAILLNDALDEIGKLNIQQALKHPVVITSNKFIKVASKKYLKEHYQPLKSKITAKKLCLQIEDFQNNPGFEEFAIKQHLHRYLFVFKHELQVDSITKDLYIKFQGKSSKWKEVQPQLKYDLKENSFLGHYSKDGLINFGLYDWKEFQPFYIEDDLKKRWGNRYLCEICSWIIDKPRIQGDHTFLRLKTPKGEIYSVGQYVPSKLGYDRYMFPMSLKPSRFMSPDVSEFWNGNFTTLSFEITEVQFYKMKNKIEMDKNSQLHLYQVFIDNCTIWAKSIAELADLELPSSLAVYDLILPNLTNFGRKINKWKYTPQIFKPFIKLIWTVFLNTTGLLLGSGMIHSSIKNNENFSGVVPYIKSVKDIFDVRKGISEHPFVIGFYVKNQVEEWRQAKTKLLKEKLTVLQDKLNQMESEQISESIPHLSLSDPAIPLSPISLSPDKEERVFFDSPTQSPTINRNINLRNVPSTYTTEILNSTLSNSPFQSPRLTPNTQFKTKYQIQQQIKNIKLAIESIQYAMPEKFKKHVKTQSHEDLPSIKPTLPPTLNRLSSTPNIPMLKK